MLETVALQRGVNLTKLVLFLQAFKRGRWHILMFDLICWTQHRSQTREAHHGLWQEHFTPLHKLPICSGQGPPCESSWSAGFQLSRDHER